MRRVIYSLMLLAFLAGGLTGCRRYSGLCDAQGCMDPCSNRSLFYAGVNCACGEGGGCATGACGAGGCANGSCAGSAPIESIAPVPATPAPTKLPPGKL